MPARVSRRILRPTLHRGHFGFLRAVVQGLPARAMWERYLPDAGDYSDGQAVHRMTGFVRGELMAAAARAGHFGRAHLLRLNLAPPADGAALPSLGTFVTTHGLDGFGEQEQQELYDDHYRADLDVQRRRTRLLRRQLLAIHALEAQLCTPVALADGCGAWFVDTLAQRLADAGIRTLGALHARMAASRDWWRPLRGIGAGKAKALTQFMAAHADTLGALPDWEANPDPDARGDVSRVPGVSPLVPLDRLIVPAALSGAAGRYRAPPTTCLLQAANDLEAIRAWIAAKAPLTTSDNGGRLSYTQLCYRKEAERFALWCVVENQTALSSTGVEDCIRYRDFLLNPPAHWCGPRSVGRWRPGWRPLEGPLSPRSCAYSMSVLNNLFNFLVMQGYLLGNPWPAVQAPVVVGEGLDTGRALTPDQWQLVCRVLDGLPVTLATLRLRVALGLLRQTGIRLAELVQASTGGLEWLVLAQPPAPPDQGWWLTVTGKGGRRRRLPLTDAWIEQLGDYLVARGLPRDPRLAEDVFLLGAAAAGAPATAGISRNVFHKQVKAFFERCASELDGTDPRGAARLRAASTHWLRHTSISQALALGAPVEIVRANAGHASLSTTSKYVQVEDSRRAQVLRQIWRG